MNALVLYIASFVHAYLRIIKPGGVKALAAENAALRHQLAIIIRGRKRAPNLELRDRILLGLMIDLIKDKRLNKVAVLLKPKTLLRWQASLRLLEIAEIKSIPGTPISHPFIERLIGTVRREYLDNVLFGNATDLQKKLDRFKRYYNTHRTHYSLKHHTPQCMMENKAVKPLDIHNYSWKPACRGLFQISIAA